jgi:hypothetical protein
MPARWLLVLPLLVLVPRNARAQEEESCIPSCRSGFICVKGACVSRCNPPCGEGETCDEEGECHLKKKKKSETLATPVEQPPPSDAYVASPTVTPSRTVHMHDGFYLRFAIGGGIGSGTFTAEDNGRNVAEGSVTAGAGGGEFALGGTVGSGFVLGGGVYTATFFSPSMTYRELGSEVSSTPRTVNDAKIGPFAVVGPFFDWYPEPRHGFHLQLGGGFAQLAYTEPADNSDTMLAVGTGFMGGLGSEFWVGEQWSLGFHARVIGGWVKATDPSDSNEHHTIFVAAPTLMMSTTFH